MENKADGAKNKRFFDVTAPGKRAEKGHLHPLTLVQRKVAEIFGAMGFEIAEGPEVETEWYNFDALNVPKDHPARDMQDTFWIKPESENPNYKIQITNKNEIQNSKFKNEKSQKLLPRTHTSNVQIRYMETHQPPIRIVAPGKVFRYEATDATHESQFYQLEGLMVDKNITLANLKSVLELFFQKFFNSKDIKIRLRPSFFPFVEPGVEVDMWYPQKEKWLEISGAGMVHPNVLKNTGLNPREYQGFAFGMGLDRLAMLKYKIDDIRLIYSGDLRFIEQF